MKTSTLNSPTQPTKIEKIISISYSAINPRIHGNMMNPQEDRAIFPPQTIHYKDEKFSLLIRPFSVADTTQLVSNIQSSLPILLPFTEWAHQVASDYHKKEKREINLQQQGKIRQARRNFAEGISYDFIVVDSVTGHFLMCASWETTHNPTLWKFDCWTAIEQRNKGLATLVTKILTGVAFYSMGCERIEIDCNKANKNALRVIEKCNFTFEGEARNYFRQPTEEMLRQGAHPERNCLHYALLLQDVENLPWYSEIKKKMWFVPFSSETIKSLFEPLDEPAGSTTARFEKTPTYPLLFLQMQIALQGRIRPQLRAVNVMIDEELQRIFLWFYFDGEIAGNDEDVCLKTSSFLRNAWPTYRVKIDVVRCDYPSAIPEEGCCVYLRDEKIPQVNIPVTAYSNDELSWVFNLHLLLLHSLLGHCRPNLRAVKTAFNEQKKIIYLWFYLDGEVSAEEQEMAFDIGKKIAVLFGSEFSSEVLVERLDYPQVIPSLGTFAFLRDESIFNEKNLFLHSPAPSLTLRYSLGAKSKYSDLQVNTVPYYDPFADDMCNIISKIRYTALNDTRSNLRAIQFEVDQFAKVAYIWLYVDGEVQEQDQQLLCHIRNGARFGYYVQASLQKLDCSVKIPQGGQYLTYRHEPHGVTNNDYLHIYAENFSNFATKEVQQIWPIDPQANLRAVLTDFVETRNTFYTLFFFRNPPNPAEIEKAKNILEILKEKFPKSQHKSYLRAIGSDEQIPTYGKVAYLASAATRPQQKKSLEKASLLYQFSCAVQQALLGMITPHLRAVKIDVDEYRKIFYFWFYFDGSLSVLDQLHVQEIVLCSNEWPEFSCTIETEQLDAPEVIPNIGRIVYSRHES